MACECQRLSLEHINGDHHPCLDCGAEVACEDAGPDVCGFEAAKADRTDQIIQMLLRMPAEAKPREAAHQIAERFGLEDAITHWDVMAAHEEATEEP